MWESQLLIVLCHPDSVLCCQGRLGVHSWDSKGQLTPQWSVFVLYTLLSGALAVCYQGGPGVHSWGSKHQLTICRPALVFYTLWSSMPRCLLSMKIKCSQLGLQVPTDSPMSYTCLLYALESCAPTSATNFPPVQSLPGVA